MKTVAEKQTSHTIRSMSALKSKNSEWEDRCGREKCAQGKLKEHLGSNRLLDDFSCATQVLSGEIFRRQRAFWSDLIFDYLAMSSTAQTLSSYSQCLFTSVPYRHPGFFSLSFSFDSKTKLLNTLPRTVLFLVATMVSFSVYPSLSGVHSSASIDVSIPLQMLWCKIP